MNIFNPTKNRNQCINALRKWNNEIDPPIERFPRGIEGTIDMFLKEGGIIIGGSEGEEKGISGYVLGEPSDNFSDKSIGYIYLMIIPKEFRNGRTFYQLGKATIEGIEKSNVAEVRFKSYKTHNYNNRLYEKLATPIGEELNSQGITSVLYSTRISDLKRKLGLNNQ